MEIDSIDERRSCCAQNFELFINLVANLNNSTASIKIPAISPPISPIHRRFKLFQPEISIQGTQVRLSPSARERQSHGGRSFIVCQLRSN